jgi:hypothetical protein
MGLDFRFFVPSPTPHFRVYHFQTRGNWCTRKFGQHDYRFQQQQFITAMYPLYSIFIPNLLIHKLNFLPHQYHLPTSLLFFFSDRIVLEPQDF